MNISSRALLSSEPRVLVIGGHPERWSTSEREHFVKYANGIETWAYAFNGDYCCHADATDRIVAEYDIVICNTNGIFNQNYCLHYRRLAENRPNRVHWVSLLEGNMIDYIRPLHHIREIFNASDVVNCINRLATPMIQSLTTSPVRYIGIPYPVDSVKSLTIPISERERKSFICALLLGRWNDYSVAKKLDIDYYGIEAQLTRKWKYMKTNLLKHGSLTNKLIRLDRARKIYNDDLLTVENDVSLHDYFRNNAKAMLWINLDERYTWGRYVLDAAALGVPIITTISTGHGSILFPQTTVATPFDVDSAISIGKKLLDDRDFYQSVVEFAQMGLEQYRPSVLKHQLLQELS